MKSFGEIVGRLELIAEMSWRDKTCLEDIFNKVIIDFDMLGAFMEKKIGDNVKMQHDYQNARELDE